MYACYFLYEYAKVSGSTDLIFLGMITLNRLYTSWPLSYQWNCHHEVNMALENSEQMFDIQSTISSITFETCWSYDLFMVLKLHLSFQNQLYY